jgi:hypothetical protein
MKAADMCKKFRLKQMLQKKRQANCWAKVWDGVANAEQIAWAHQWPLDVAWLEEEERERKLRKENEASAEEDEEKVEATDEEEEEEEDEEEEDEEEENDDVRLEPLRKFLEEVTRAAAPADVVRLKHLFADPAPDPAPAPADDARLEPLPAAPDPAPAPADDVRLESLPPAARPDFDVSSMKSYTKVSGGIGANPSNGP